VRYTVTGAGPYQLSEDAEPVAELASADDVVFVVYQRCYGLAAELLQQAGWVALHGALATIDGVRVLVAGPKGAGKTTLALRLLFDGHPVEGDERVHLRDGDAVALPRRFHCKPGVERHVPELAPLLASLPTTTAWIDGAPQTITAFDPTECGIGWQLRCGPVDACVLLSDTDAGADARVEPLPTARALPLITEHLFDHPGLESPAVASTVAALLRTAPAFSLRRGTPEDTVATLRGALAGVDAHA